MRNEKEHVKQVEHRQQDGRLGLDTGMQTQAELRV